MPVVRQKWGANPPLFTESPETSRWQPSAARTIVNREQLDDPQPASARGQFEQGYFAHCLADQCTTDGGRHRDMPLVEILRISENEVIGLGDLCILTNHDYSRAEPNLVGRDLAHVHGRQLAQPLAKLAEPRLDELLPLERGLVFAVLSQVSELHGFADLVGKDDVKLVLELFRFGAELLLECLEHMQPTSLQKVERPACEGRALDLALKLPARPGHFNYSAPRG